MGDPRSYTGLRFGTTKCPDFSCIALIDRHCGLHYTVTCHCFNTACYDVICAGAAAAAATAATVTLRCVFFALRLCSVLSLDVSTSSLWEGKGPCEDIFAGEVKIADFGHDVRGTAGRGLYNCRYLRAFRLELRELAGTGLLVLVRMQEVDYFLHPIRVAVSGEPGARYK